MCVHLNQIAGDIERLLFQNKNYIMLISVITVCYNSSVTIEKTIESVESQSYNNIEYIIVDGGSKDTTLDIIKKHSRTVNIFLSEPDEGIYDAMNKGIHLANGDYICFLNSDDAFCDNKVIEDIVFYLKNKSPDLVFTDVNILSRSYPKKIVRKYLSKNFSKRMMLYGLMPPHPGIFTAKELFFKFGGFDKSFKIAGDFDLILRFLYVHHCSFTCLQRFTVDMLAGGVSSSGFSSKWTVLFEVKRALKKIGLNYNLAFIFYGYILKLMQVNFLVIFRGGR